MSRVVLRSKSIRHSTLLHTRFTSSALCRREVALKARFASVRSHSWGKGFATKSSVRSSPKGQFDQSKGNWLSSITIATCIVGLSAFYFSHTEHLETWRHRAPRDEYQNPSMPDTTAPGRLGALTVDEEVKLQEAWRRLAHICNMPTDDDEEEGAEAANGDAHSVDKDNGNGKKTRRPKMFRKRSNAVALEHAEEDDKYGQTKEYQQALKDNTPEDIRSTIWSMVKMDHPDSLILRFLRARKWDIDRALVMMISTMNWRKHEMHIEDTIVHQGESVGLKSEADQTKDDQGFMEQYREGKSFVHGVDKNGRPICIVRVRLHTPGAQTMKSLEEYTVHTIETARMTLRDPVDTATLIFDMTDFSLRNMDNKPVQFMIKCFEANYPESLGLVTVHKAPWLFQGVWRLIRGWLDPVVAGKIHFTNSTDDLAQFIPRENILKEFGGDDDWAYEYVEPTEEENASLRDTAGRDKLLEERTVLVEEFEALTRRWLRYAPTEPEFRTLMAERNAVAEKMRVQYWHLDPYIRARTLYDRTGIISEGGKIDFYPYRTNAKPS